MTKMYSRFRYQCENGHVLCEDHVYVTGRGYLICKLCETKRKAPPDDVQPKVVLKPLRECANCGFPALNDEHQAWCPGGV